MVSLFGFTKKTADKIIAALKDRMGALRLAGREKWSPAVEITGVREAIAALVHLGYRESEARSALERLPSQTRSSGSTAELIREALIQLS